MRKSKIIRKRPHRHSLRIPCQAVRERGFSLVADELRDLSPWGALVGPADPILTGERVYLSFRLPGSTEYIDTMATVARVVHGRRAGEGTRLLGLAFDPLSPHDQFRIRRALLGTPVVPPSARLGRRIPVDLAALLI